MKKMAAGSFKTNCLAVMAEVQAKRESVVITKHCKPVAITSVADAEGAVFDSEQANGIVLRGRYEGDRPGTEPSRIEKTNSEGTIQFQTDGRILPGSGYPKKIDKAAEQRTNGNQQKSRTASFIQEENQCEAG